MSCDAAHGVSINLFNWLMRKCVQNKYWWWKRGWFLFTVVEHNYIRPPGTHVYTLESHSVINSISNLWRSIYDPMNIYIFCNNSIAYTTSNTMIHVPQKVQKSAVFLRPNSNSLKVQRIVLFQVTCYSKSKEACRLGKSFHRHSSMTPKGYIFHNHCMMAWS